MQSTSNFKASFILFAALPVVFFLVFGLDGMDAADRGFIPAFASRILSGQTIYQDFFYVRPPLTPYLHTFEMALFPEALEMAAYRFFFYAFMWLSVLLSILSLRRFFDVGQIGLSPWLLGSIAYLLSIHNFFAAPWHTVDGVLMGSLGIYLLTRGPSLGTMSLGLFAMGLSAMAKQPFAVVPLVGIVLAFVLYPWKKAALATGLTLVVAGIAALAIEFWFTPGHPFFQLMLTQTTGVTSLREMQWSAINLYVRPGLVAFVPGAIIWYILKYRMRSAMTPTVMGIFAFAGIALVAIGPLAITMRAHHFVMPKQGFYHGLLFLGGMIAVLSIWKRDRKGLAVLLAMMAIDWASSISWGYATPVLYSLPPLFAIAYFTTTIAEFRAPRWFWPSLFALVTICIATVNLYVYDDDFRTEITHDMGELFPRLSHIDAGPQQYARYAELKQLHAKYGDAFTVLPSMPAAHYVTETPPRIKADWVHDGEINYQNGISETIQTLEQSRNYVFALRGEMNRINETGTFRCSVLRHVVDHWAKIDSTSEFWVYENGVR